MKAICICFIFFLSVCGIMFGDDVLEKYANQVPCMLEDVLKNQRKFNVQKLLKKIEIEKDEEYQRLLITKELLVEHILKVKRDCLSSIFTEGIECRKLSDFQKVSLAMFLTQWDSKENCIKEIKSSFLLAGALNTLANKEDEISKYMLKCFIEKTPKDFLEDSDY